MITYNKGQWGEDQSMPDTYTYSSKDGLTYQGYDRHPMWSMGVEHALQVDFYWPTDECIDSTKYRYLAHIETYAWNDALLITDLPSLLMFLKEMAPLFQDAREQELYEMAAEEHVWRAKDRQSETREHIRCGHL